MKFRTLCAAAVSLLATAAFAQSNVTIYGIADAAVRHVDHAGDPKNPGASKTALSSGLSESRIGFKGTEDLGDGLSAFFNLEHRFELDTGENAPNAPFFQLSYVGLTTPVGRISLGRQYNVLLDISYSTYASFRYSPYIEAFKPEMGFAFGSRQDNMLKYAASVGGFSFEVQASIENGAPTSGTLSNVPYNFTLPNKSRGVMARYEQNGIAGGGAIMEVRDSAGNKARATTFGASYTHGDLYVNASVVRNSFDAGFGAVSSNVPAVATGVRGSLLNLIVDSPTTGVTSVDLDRRDAFSFGATYSFTPAFNLGAQYWGIRQVGRTGAADGKSSMAAIVADYALSKRTDVYAELDHTHFGSGAMAYADGSKTRVGYMAGMRHRF